MRKVLYLLVGCLLMTGCSARETFEHIGDDYLQETPVQHQILCALPEDASAQTVQSAYGQLYFCDGYEITMQTLPAGDLDRTLRELTGYGKENLTVMETGVTSAARYDCVWTAAGEGGDMVGRAAVLDDGNYHYCMTVMASQSEAAELRDTWKALFDSFMLG